MARTKNVRVVNIKSSVKDKKPAVGDIDYGEIAVNYNSGSTFLAVKDSKNEIKVFTDKTTNDADYAPKSEFDTLSNTVNDVNEGLTELQNNVIDNEETTSAALNDLNSRVNQLSSVDMGDYATTATTEGIKSDISGLKESVKSNENEISALKTNSHKLFKAAVCTTYTDDTGGLTPAAVKKAFDGQLTAANATNASYTTRMMASSLATRGTTIGEFQTNLKNFVLETISSNQRAYKIINTSFEIGQFVKDWNNNNTGGTISEGGYVDFIPLVTPTKVTSPYCAWIVSTYSDKQQYLLVLSNGNFSRMRQISTDIDLSQYVSTSRTINGTALTQNIVIKKVDSATTSSNVNGYTVAKSVPSNAIFTDTTYDDATTSTHGLMTAADKTKLNGIASGATKYSHPTFTAKTSGFYKIAVNNEGHVTGTTNVAASDITGLIGTPSLTGHNHDDRYYTESEIDTKLSTKSNTGHNHDDRYYTETEIDAKLATKSNTGHTHTKSDITDLAAWAKANTKPSYNFNEIAGTVDVTSQLNGIIPAANLPSYVDDVLEYNGKTNFPTTGETGKIYVDTSTNLTYRWGGSAYIEISPSLALGETSGTAYRGDRGKIAYDHSQITSGNPHKVTKLDVGLGNVEDKSSATIRGEITKDNVTTALGYTPVSEGTIEANELVTASSLNDLKENITTLSSSTVSINGSMVTGATMSSTATEPSVSNNTLTIPTVAGAKGDKGVDGTSAGFGTPTAEVDSNTGTPSVTITATGPDTAKVFAFKFKNLKGKDGTNGTNGTNGTSASITGASATATTLAAGNDATASVTTTGSNTSRGFSFTFGIPKGEKGDTGAKGDVGPSANATASNDKRYLMGLSSTTGNITGATTSGSCYMSGGCLYSKNEKVLTTNDVANSSLGVRDYASTGDTIQIGYNGNSLNATDITFIAAYKSGRYIKDASAEAVINFLSAVTKSDLNSRGYLTSSSLNDYVTNTELNGKGYLTAVTVSNHYSPNGGSYVSNGASTENSRNPITDFRIDDKGHITQVWKSGNDVAYRDEIPDISGYYTSAQTNGMYVHKSGDTISGTLYIEKAGGTSLSANGQTYLDNVQIKDGLSITGATNMSDDLTITGRVSASNGFFQTSDRRLKNFQGDVEVDFDKLKSIPKKYFYWNLDSKKSKLEIGTSAQEVMEVYPELVSMNESGMLSVAYDKLSVIALKAVDELHDENKALKEKNEELERRLKAIEEKLGI